MSDYMLYCGDCRALLRALPAESIHACVCDPPYGLSSKQPNPIDVMRAWVAGEEYAATGSGFASAKWDAFVPGPDAWREVLRVLMPGAFAFTFGAPKTFAWTWLAMRLAGFEPWDVISWVQAMGMPKNGGRLKPAWEPVIVMRKPVQGTAAANFATFGVGRLNIDEGRIPCTPEDFAKWSAGVESKRKNGGKRDRSAFNDSDLSGANPANPLGRWPPNFALDSIAGAVLDWQVGDRKGMSGGGEHRADYAGGMFGAHDSTQTARADVGGPSRFFWCPKVSRSDRDSGLDDLTERNGAEVTSRKPGSKGLANPMAGPGRGGARNPALTVKPEGLMRWLVRLASYRGQIVIDPYMGSGSTGKACMLEGRDFVGFDEQQLMVDVAKKRIKHAQKEAG